MSTGLKRDQYGRPIYEISDPVLAAFMLSNAPVQVIQGPIRSGKSKASNLKLWSYASAQVPGANGIRHTRWGIVRNTYPLLKTTTMRTWLHTFPEATYGRVVWSQPPRQVIRAGDVLMENDFLALDDEGDVEKLRSGEYTGFYVNELQFLPKVLLDEMTSRAKQFPAMMDGGATWGGVVCDMNAPEDEHFIALMTGQSEWPVGTTDEEKAEMTWPSDWDFFMQPPGLLEEPMPDGSIAYRPNPAAENQKWLPKDFYIDALKGKGRPWIKSRLLNKIALVIEGSPVYPMFREDFHVAREVLKPVVGREVLVAVDAGRWPAALFVQEIDARIFVQHELLGFNEPAVVWAPKVKRFLEKHYPGSQFRVVGDPAAKHRGQATDDSFKQVFEANGMPFTLVPLPKVELAVNAVSHLLNDNPSGIPRFVLSPNCRTTKVGLAGRYCLEKDETGVLKPTKNRYSHPCNALEFGVLSLGEGRRMIGLTPAGQAKPVVVRRRLGAGRRG